MGNRGPHRPLPAVRIVKQGVAPPPGWRSRALRSRVDALFAPVMPSLRTGAAYFIGLFPLFATVILAIAFLWAAGLRGAP